MNQIHTGTLLLQRHQVSALLSITECIEAVERAFQLYAENKSLRPKILGVHSEKGGFHIKAGLLHLEKTYFAAKANSNFPTNMKQEALPLIQGVIVLFDGDNGKVLAVLDSIEITIIRTGAATAVAAKYLSRDDSKIITICGCGNQGIVSLKAIMKVRCLEKVFAFDIDEEVVKRFARLFAKEIQVVQVNQNDLAGALRESDIVVTCTPSSNAFIFSKDIIPGTFIAAVGADSEQKQEIEPALITSNMLVVDLIEQCASIGELHHVLKETDFKISDVHAEIGDIIAGLKPARTSKDEIIIFDSTGTALQDIAAAAIVYEKAVQHGIGITLDFGKSQ